MMTINLYLPNQWSGIGTFSLKGQVARGSWSLVSHLFSINQLKRSVVIEVKSVTNKDIKIRNNKCL